MADRPSFPARVALAFAWFFRILFSGDWAARLVGMELALPEPPSGSAAERPSPAAAPQPPKAPSEAPRAAPTDAALQVLALFQREGRLVDFLKQDIASFADADIGAAARVVHEGCRRALVAHVDIEPVRVEPEGATVVVDAGTAPSLHKLTGNVSGVPPHRGTLRHRGWRATRIELPRLVGDHDVTVLAAAEVEL